MLIVHVFASGIEKKRSFPYHPQGDEQAERCVQTFKQVMRCLLEDRNINKSDWPSLLSELTFVIYSLPNASSKLSPLRMYSDSQVPVVDGTGYVGEESCGH